MSMLSTRWFTLPTLIASSATLALVAGSAFAQTDVKTVQPYYAAVTQDATNLRAGPSERFYSILSVPAATLLAVDGEASGWVRVLYPAATPAFVRAEDVDATASTLTLRTESRLRAASQVHGYAGSWMTLLETPLPSGTSLTLVEPVKEGEVITGYKVQAPESARAYIGSSRVRRATEEEVKNALAKNIALPALPSVTISATTTTESTTSTASAQPSSTASTETGTPSSSPSDTSPESSANALPATTQDTPLTPPPERTPETLEALFRKVWAEPVQSAEVDELMTQYEVAIAAVASDQPRRKAALEQRLNALQVRREYRESLRREQREATAQTQADVQLKQQLDQWAAGRVYTIVGTLQPSTVYDGQRLPGMYRIVSVGGTSPRTLGYIRKSKDADYDRLLGSVVGIIGEANIDRSLQLNIITPVRLDALRSAAASNVTPTNIPAAQPQTQPEPTTISPAETPAPADAPQNPSPESSDPTGLG
jgi:hypothetical protein